MGGEQGSGTGAIERHTSATADCSGQIGDEIMMNWIYDPAIPGILYWFVAGLIGATVGCGIYVAYEHWRINR
jgi:hypothetical protein